MSAEHDFIEYPRGDLSFTLSRRELFTSLRSDLARRAQADPSIAQYPLRRLGALPKDRLAEIVPAVVPGSRFTTIDDAIWGQSPSDTSLRQLFEASDANLLVLDAMRGRDSLRTIAGSIVRELGWPGDRSFALVRGLFLHLVSAGIVVPASTTR
jgi:hypothetical protein